MVDDGTLNLAEKQALGGSFFAAVKVLKDLNNLEVIRMDSTKQEKKAREIADQVEKLIQVEASLSHEFATTAESGIISLLRRLKDIPRKEPNVSVVAEDAIVQAQYYIVSYMFDLAESKKLVRREDMVGTSFEGVIPPRPTFPI